MLKCKICGTEFPAIKDKHYITRDNVVNGGLSQSLNGNREKISMIALIALIADAK